MLFGPGGDFFLAFRAFMAENGKAFSDDGTGTGIGKILNGVGKPAALAGAQGKNSFAGQVVMLQERQKAHGQGAAPAGETDKNSVIPGYIPDIALDGRTGIGLGLLGGLHAAGAVILGIGFYCIHFKQIPVHGFCYKFSGIGSISFGDTANSAGEEVFTLAGIVNDQTPCHNDLSLPQYSLPLYDVLKRKSRKMKRFR